MRYPSPWSSSRPSRVSVRPSRSTSYRGPRDSSGVRSFCTAKCPRLRVIIPLRPSAKVTLCPSLYVPCIMQPSWLTLVLSYISNTAPSGRSRGHREFNRDDPSLGDHEPLLFGNPQPAIQNIEPFIHEHIRIGAFGSTGVACCRRAPRAEGRRVAGTHLERCKTGDGRRR